MNLRQGKVLDRLLAEAVRLHNVLPLTGRCNLSCLFCSHNYNPPGTEAYSFPPLSESRWSDLINYLDPARKIIIGESATRLREGEPFSHPQIIKVIEKLRTLYPQTVIQLTTNGSLLNRELVCRLAALKPLEIILSINSASERGRRLLMNDPCPELALALPALFREYSLKFHGSLVAMPHLVGFDDLLTTIQLLDYYGALTIRFLLPGYTRLSKVPTRLSSDLTEELYQFIKTLKQKDSAIILAEPPQITDLDALVEGVLPDSPAQLAGIKGGDLILEVNNRPVISRVDAFNRLNANMRAELKIESGQRKHSIFLKKDKDQASGLVMDYDLNPDQLGAVKDILGKKKQVLMLVSSPAFKRWQIIAQQEKLYNLKLKAVTSYYFGGSIDCAGLLTVSDYQRALLDAGELNSCDAVLLPTIAFNEQGRDMSGESYLGLKSSQASLILID